MNFRTPEDAKAPLEVLDQGLADAGRTRDEFVVEARLSYGEGDPKVWESMIRDYRALGLNDFVLNTMESGLRGPSDHQAAIRRFADAVDLGGD